MFEFDCECGKKTAIPESRVNECTRIMGAMPFTCECGKKYSIEPYSGGYRVTER